MSDQTKVNGGAQEENDREAVKGGGDPDMY